MDKQTITSIYNTLCKLDVHGRDNLSRLLGCLQKLEELMAQPDCADKEAQHGS